MRYTAGSTTQQHTSVPRQCASFSGYSRYSQKFSQISSFVHFSSFLIGKHLSNPGGIGGSEHSPLEPTHAKRTKKIKSTMVGFFIYQYETCPKHNAKWVKRRAGFLPHFPASLDGMLVDMMARTQKRGMIRYINLVAIMNRIPFCFVLILLWGRVDYWYVYSFLCSIALYIQPTYTILISVSLSISLYISISTSSVLGLLQ